MTRQQSLDLDIVNSVTGLTSSRASLGTTSELPGNFPTEVPLYFSDSVAITIRTIAICY